MKERRKYPRLSIPIRVRVRPLHAQRAGSFATLCLTRNFAQQGLFLTTQKVLSKGTDAAIELHLDGSKKPIHLLSKVVWVADRTRHPYFYPGMALRIMRITPEARKTLHRFFDEKMQNYRDAQELHQMYDALKTMAARLLDIEDRHKLAGHFRRIIDRAVREIDEVAHLIDQGVWNVKRL